MTKDYQGYEEFLDAIASRLSLSHNRETNIPYGKHHLHLTPNSRSNDITVKVFDLSLKEFNQLIDLLDSFQTNSSSKKREDMSYRSEVAIVFDKNQLSVENLEATRHLLKKLNETYKPTTNKIFESYRYIQFYDDFLKWSHTDKEVYAIHNFLELLNENAYSYVRVGEEIGDIEFKGDSSHAILILQQVDQDSLPVNISD